MPSQDPERDRRLVHSQVESGQLTPEQGRALLAETVRGPNPPATPGALPKLRPISAAEAHALTAPGARWGEGEVIGAYRLDALLGRGGAGEVWRATHVPTGASRALKTLLPFAEANDRARFLREAQALATLDGHPHVVRVHEVGEAAQRAFLVMDLARPEDLNQRLKAGPLPGDEARALLAALASGLAHVHAHGLMHRDLKPHNVLFADDGRPLLSDFGLVRGPSRSSLSVTGEILGTPAYMAPEQALGEPVDERTDVYGLGAVLYHVLTGRPPFNGKTPISVLQQVVQKTPSAPSKLVEGVPRDLEQVCLRALAKDPNDRYPSARALLEALHSAPSVHRWPLALLGASLLGLGLAAGALARTATRPPTTANRPSPTAATPTPGLASASLPPPDATPAHPAPTQVERRAQLLQAFLDGLDLEQATRVVFDDPRYEDATYALGPNPTAPDYLNTASLLRRKGAPGRVIASFFSAGAALDANGWHAFANFVSDTSNERLGLPGDASRAELSVAMLERGAAGSSLACVRNLGHVLASEAWKDSVDPDRVFELYLAGMYEPGEDDYDAHLLETVRFALDPPRPFRERPDPELLLELVNAATYCTTPSPDLRLQRLLGDARYGLTREVGEAALQALEANAPALDGARLEVEFPYLCTLGGPGGWFKDAATLDLAGQFLSRQGPEQRDSAARCFLLATQGGNTNAWSNLANLVRHWLELGPDTRRFALLEHCEWLAAELHDPRAIAHLGYAQRILARRVPCELQRLAEIAGHLSSLEFPPTFDTIQKLKLALTVGEAALQTPRRERRFSVEQALSCLRGALSAPPTERSQGLRAEVQALLAELEGRAARGD